MPIGVLLLICVLYAWKHKGSDAPGIVLGVCLGVAGAGGIIGTLANPVIQAIDAVGDAAIDIGRRWVPGGGAAPVAVFHLAHALIVQ